MPCHGKAWWNYHSTALGLKVAQAQYQPLSCYVGSRGKGNQSTMPEALCFFYSRWPRNRQTASQEYPIKHVAWCNVQVYHTQKEGGNHCCRKILTDLDAFSWISSSVLQSPTSTCQPQKAWVIKIRAERCFHNDLGWWINESAVIIEFKSGSYCCSGASIKFALGGDRQAKAWEHATVHTARESSQKSLQCGAISLLRG